MFEIQLKNRELQKHLFDLIGGGTITPDFLTKLMFEDVNKTLNIEYLSMEKIYKNKEDYTDLEMKKFIDENKDQLIREFIDFKYVLLNPNNLIELNEFNQEFFDEIDKIENRISQGDDFETILKNINAEITEVKEFIPTSVKKENEDEIYSKRSTKIDLIEKGDNFLLYSITNNYNKAPDLTIQSDKNQIRELIYQKGKFDLNKDILEKIQKNEFNNNKFNELASKNVEFVSINSINDNNKFEENSVKMIYSLPINSFTLVSDNEKKIYLVKIVSSKKNNYSKKE
jgi:hypothetical protein